MALQKQLVPLIVEQGLDTKTDNKQKEPGFLIAAQNIVYETIHKLKKRNGYDIIELYDTNYNPISNPLQVSKLKSELVLLTDTKLYSYSSSLGRFSEKGRIAPVRISSNVIVKNSLDQMQTDGLAVDNFQVYTWSDSQGNVKYSVQDSNDGSFIVADSLVGAGARPCLGRIQNIVYILYIDGTDINFKSFSILQPETLSAATTVASNADAVAPLLDCKSVGTKVMVAYNSSTNIKVFSINNGGTTSSIVGITGENATDALDVSTDAASRVIIVWSDGTAVKCAIYPYTLSASILLPTTVEAIADVKTCCLIETSAGNYTLFYEVEQATIGDNYVKTNTMNVSGTVGTPSVFIRSCGLGARAFIYDNHVYCTVVHESEIQSTYFVLDSSARTIAKFANQNAASVLTNGVLPEVSWITSTDALIPALFRNRLIGLDGNVFVSTNGVLEARLSFNGRFSTAELAESLHIAAGMLKMYDGASVTESGFNVFPENLTSPNTSNTGGSMSDGNYAYVAIYKWTDNTGRDHRSSPTLVPLEVILSGGTSTQKVSLSVPTLRITEKESVAIEIYRTENNGVQYYKITSDTNPLLNNPAVDAVTFDDTLSDLSLISKEALYTTGGILENIAPGAVREVCVYNGERIAYLDEERAKVRWSKIIDENGPVEYNDAIYRDIDPTAGQLTTIASMQEKLIVFSADGSYFVTGDGPNNAGQNDSFTKPEVLSLDMAVQHLLLLAFSLKAEKVYGHTEAAECSTLAIKLRLTIDKM
jgi:hypothetical protein